MRRARSIRRSKTYSNRKLAAANQNSPHAYNMYKDGVFQLLRRVTVGRRPTIAKRTNVAVA